MMQNNPGSRQVYSSQIMAQQARALDTLQKVSQLEQAMDSNQANGNSEGSASGRVESQTEVCDS